MQRVFHELLAPAGDMQSLHAAVCAGADAVYFGASDFNARKRAANFTKDEIKDAIDYCHAYGRKAYITLNTALKEKELDGALALAGEIYTAGADAVICSDLGLISLIREQIPSLEVHISTQAGVRSTESADFFSSLGAKRVVLARELSFDEIKSVTEKACAETEVFIHGALCVSVSGRCLFSSLVGGRSGNRGECAQPCRLSYGKDGYLLSLKDLCLAKHIKKLCDAGVASFKIEGRMKSPEYVYSVTKIYRDIIDGKRNGTYDEVRKLSEIFSRDGFTDGYFTKKIAPAMKGIRGELTEPKRELSGRIEEKKTPLFLEAKIKRGEKFSLSYCTADKSEKASVFGEIPEKAQNRPMRDEDYLRPLSALGGTPFCLEGAKIDCDKGLMLPLSSLKRARREALDLLLSQRIITREEVKTSYTPCPSSKSSGLKSAKFYLPESVSEEAQSFFDVIFIPARKYDKKIANGAFLPEITSESESEETRILLASLKGKGCEHILVSDISQLSLAREAGFANIHTDIGFNIYNNKSVSLLGEYTKIRAIASPELNLSAQRGLSGAIVVYGRIPLMVLKKCIGRELIGCERCKKGDGRFSFKDRKGITFTGMREGEHMSVIFNSIPTYIGDTPEAKALRDIHFIFTLENTVEANKVIDSYKKGLSLGRDVRRIK